MASAVQRSRARPTVLVSVVDPATRSLLVQGLEALRHPVIVSAPTDALTRAHGSGVAGAVFAAQSHAPAELERALADVAATHPRCRAIVLDAWDGAGLDAALRHGARPCGVRLDGAALRPSADLSRQLTAEISAAICRPDVPGDGPAVSAVQRALAAAAREDLVSAAIELSAIEGIASRFAAVDRLVGVIAELSDLLDRRCRYSVPVALVRERLAVDRPGDRALCQEILDRGVERAAGLDVELGKLMVRHGERAVLFGAFHSALACVRFVAARTWRSPSVVVAQLDHAWSAPAPDGQATASSTGATIPRTERDADRAATASQ